MKLNCLVADDEPVARKLLHEYIGDIDFLEWKGSVDNALKAGDLLGRETIDLLFLDINMPKLSGVEFLRTATALPMVILTTAYAEYATQGFELDVLDYLVKPFSFERFVKACNKARDYHLLKHRGEAGNGSTAGAAAAERTSVGTAEQPPDHFFVKSNGRIEKILYDDLLLVEAMQNYVLLHTGQGKLIVYHTIKGILEQLPASIFVKVHKSSIVNLTKVRSITGNELDLGGLKVTVSQSAYESTMKAILQDRMIKR